ncbi:DnaD domain-containing protein [Bacillus sp. FJAT-28004]|uniref:DnaD domain-containing protein n=1 Tax=Bacillus sp. FJAT-28004 TaxID=1679165 RepID=UPI0006B513F5|nr:DnaD domain protein [Bacillus sp. FJAT-28004]
MAWIESHQELARHPKTKRLSRRLGVNVPTAIGHLHMLWWWALDYAPGGDITAYESEDIAEAVNWPIETADMLMTALIDSGFIDKTDNVTVHDWFDYAGRLVDKREQNKQRKRKSRAKQGESEASHSVVTRDTSVTQSDDKRGHGATERTQQNPTEPNRTIPNHTSTQPKQAATPPAAGSINPVYNPFRLYEAEGFGTISSITADKINDFIKDYGERWVCEAMKTATVAGKRNLTYVNGILKRYKAEGVDEPWNVERKSSSTNQSSSRSGKPRIEIVSDNRPKAVVTDETLRELCDLSRKADGLPQATEADYLDFIRTARKE